MYIYLEEFLQIHQDFKYLFTEDDHTLAPSQLRSKSQYIKALCDNVWQNQEFITLAPQVVPVNNRGYPRDVASHSVCKYPAEHATKQRSLNQQNRNTSTLEG